LGDVYNTAVAEARSFEVLILDGFWQDRDLENQILPSPLRRSDWGTEQAASDKRTALVHRMGEKRTKTVIPRSLQRDRFATSIAAGKCKAIPFIQQTHTR